MDNRPIGVFDSGLGGITAVRELRRLLPHENIVYFGDTGRVPYGTRSREIIRKYAAQDVAFLRGHDVKLIIAACGTVSASLTPQLISDAGVPLMGVVQPAAQAACASTSNGRIGVIGTAATVRSGAYGKAVRAVNPDLHVYGNACPLFVPLVENGFIEPDNAVTEQVAKMYLAPILEADVDTLILGCTHFPLIAPVIARIAGGHVTLIDAGREVARWAQTFLTQESLLCEREDAGKCSFFVSDAPEGFAETAQMYLGEPVAGDVTQIDVESLYTL